MAALQCLCDLGVLFLKICQIYALYVWRCFVPKSKKSVVGEVVVITGAGHGMGQEVARRLGRLGAKLALLDIAKKGIDELADEINQNGGCARSYICDVTNDVMVSETAKRIEDELGDVTILINNAGIAHGEDILALSMSRIQKTFDVNIVAYIRMVQTFLPKMLENKRGHILNMVSIAGFLGFSRLTDYCASKHAAHGFTTALREEIRLLHKEPIKVTSVYPHFVDTGIIEKEQMIPGKGGYIMTIDYAAEAIVNGLLREETEVVVPSSRRLAATLGVMVPYEINAALFEFLGFGVGPKQRSRRPSWN